MSKNKTFESIEFKFKNPFTNEEEEYDYYLDFEDMVTAIKLYADFYDVNLDGTDTHIWNLFVSLDSGRYEHLNEVFSKICESDYVQDQLKQKLEEKAKEEFEQEAEDEYDSEQDN